MTARSALPRRSRLGGLEDELRHRGLPLLVTPSRRLRGLVGRSAPMLVVVGMLYSYYVWASVVFERVAASHDLDLTSADDLPSRTALLLGTLVLVAIALLVLAPLVFWMLLRLNRRGGVVTDWVLTVLAVLLLVVLPLLIAPGHWFSVLFESLVLVALLLSISYLGIGVLVVWSLRRTVLELGAVGAMVVRVLPMLLLVILFLFFNTEIWQIASPLPWRKVWLTGGIIWLLTLTLTVVTTSDVLSESPLRSTLKQSERAPRRSEVINVTAVPALVMAIQAVIFGVVVFGFLVGFGLVSVPVETVTQWLGHPPRTISPWLHLDGLNGELLKVSVLLAAFSALNFVASMATDSRHRAVFMGSILDELAEGLELREPYLAQIERRSDAPVPAPATPGSATPTTGAAASPAGAAAPSTPEPEHPVNEHPGSEESSEQG